MRRLTWICVLGLCMALGACDEGGGEDAGTDTGTATDTGMRTDTGASADTGTPTDTGAPMDTGPGGDSGGDTSMADTSVPLSCAASTIRIEDVCPEFTACGGDLVGDWCYADICITKSDLLQAALDMAGAVIPDCTVDLIEVRSSTGTAMGTVSIDATMVTRQVMTMATGTFFLPDPECVLVNCAATAGAINGALGPGAATCSMASGGCDCDINFMSMADEMDAYTLAGNTIVLTDGRVFDYCVEGGGELRFSQQPPAGGGGFEPGIQTVLPDPAP